VGLGKWSALTDQWSTLTWALTRLGGPDNGLSWAGSARTHVVKAGGHMAHTGSFEAWSTRVAHGGQRGAGLWTIGTVHGGSHPLCLSLASAYGALGAHGSRRGARQLPLSLTTARSRVLVPW
jgi:hypothetical protein